MYKCVDENGNSSYQDGYVGNGNIRLDPLMSGTERPHLREGSPAIDAGTNTPPFGVPDTDFDGDDRIVDGDGNGSAIADMGADEFVPGALSGIWYVDHEVSASGNGQSWNTAFKTIEEAVANLFAGDEIWVKGGAYLPTGGTVAPLAITQADIGLYGGFAGWETQREQRNWNAHETIIDGGNTSTRTIFISENGGGIILDGFTVTHGGTSATVEFFAISGVNTVRKCR